MVQISEEVKTFIDKHAQQIDDNRWHEIYSSSNYQALNPSACGEFTELMYKAGIDPLQYMVYVPDYYLFGSSFAQIIIRDGIVTICQAAFRKCLDLKTVTLPISVGYIEDYAFANCPSFMEIIYLGTKAQWRAILKAETWDDSTEDYIITCTDGVIERK